MRLSRKFVCNLGVAACLCVFGIAPRAHATGAVPPQAAGAMSAVADENATDFRPKSVIPVCVPIGLASYKGLLYVANHWTSSGCGSPGQITVYSRASKQLVRRTITTDIYNPAGLAFDARGNLYVADGTKDQVTVYDPTGKELKS